MEGEPPERYSCAPTLPGPKQLMAHYKGDRILMNNESSIVLSMIRSYSTIYTQFTTSIFMYLKFLHDNYGQSSLPRLSHQSGETSQSGPGLVPSGSKVTLATDALQEPYKHQTAR